MSKLSKEEILASSTGWVASLLNFLPGLGSGYLYQRRWIPYFLTSGAVIAWFSIGIVLQNGEEPSQTEQLVGIIGLFIISIITVIEANLAFKKAVNSANIKAKEKNQPEKRSWFK